MIWRLALIALLGAPMAMFGMWAADRERPTVIVRASVEKDIAAPGDVIRVRYLVRRFKSCQIRTDRVLFDALGVRTVLPEFNFNAAPGPVGEDTYAVTFEVPHNFAAGLARYRTTSLYFCNPLHYIWPIVVPAPDLVFSVIPGPARESRRQPQENARAD